MIWFRDWHLAAALLLILSGAAKLLPGSRLQVAVRLGMGARSAAIAAGIAELWLSVCLLVLPPGLPRVVVGTVTACGLIAVALLEFRGPADSGCGCFGRLSDAETRRTQTLLRATMAAALLLGGSLSANMSVHPASLLGACVPLAAILLLSRPELERVRLDLFAWRRSAVRGRLDVPARVKDSGAYRQLLPTLVTEDPVEIFQAGSVLVLTFLSWDVTTGVVRDVRVSVRRFPLVGFVRARVLPEPSGRIGNAQTAF